VVFEVVSTPLRALSTLILDLEEDFALTCALLAEILADLLVLSLLGAELTPFLVLKEDFTLPYSLLTPALAPVVLLPLPDA